MRNYQHDYSYDWLRAFSAIMIVLCHICQGFGISSEFVYYLGGTYVAVFLMLSAYLLGEHYREHITEVPLEFFKKRMNRLIPTYYIYLTIIFIIIGVCIGFEHLSWQQITGHYFFVNWFLPSTRIFQSPLPQLGHLWFMSCIVLAYLIVVVLALIPSFTKQTRRFWLCFSIGTACMGTCLCAYSRYFIYPSVVFVLFPLIFFKGHEILVYTRKCSKPLLITALVLCNLSAIGGFQFGLRENAPLVFWAIAINSMLWIVTAPIVFNKNHIPHTIAFFSTISFEIYLVHHPLCLGYYSLSKYMDTWIAIIMVFALSVSLGYLLSLLTKAIICCINKLPFTHSRI